jgi:hypothetical protein
MVVGRVKVKGGEDADIVVGGHDNAVLMPHGDRKEPGGPGGPGSVSGGFGPSHSGPGLVGYGGSGVPPPSYGSSVAGDSVRGPNDYPPEKTSYR